jgi:hypothetical protein
MRRKVNKLPTASATRHAAFSTASNYQSDSEGFYEFNLLHITHHIEAFTHKNVIIINTAQSHSMHFIIFVNALLVTI